MSLTFFVCLFASAGSLYVIANSSRISASMSEFAPAESVEGMEMVAQDLVSVLSTIPGYEANAITVRFGSISTELGAAMVNELDDQGYQLQSLYKADSPYRLSTRINHSDSDGDQLIRCSLAIARIKLYRDYEETENGLVAAGPVYVLKERAASARPGMSENTLLAPPGVDS